MYDRATNDFMACIFVGLSIDFLEEKMRESRVTPSSEVSIVRWEPGGAVLASSAYNMSQSSRVVSIDHLHIGLTNETYEELYTLVNYSSVWDPQNVQEAYNAFSAQADGFFVAVYPIPPIPDTFVSDYQPFFLAIVSTAEADVFDKVNEVNDDVDDRVDRSILFSVVVGAAGCGLATVVIIVTSTSITRPLQQMNKEAELIVGSFGDDTSDNVKQIQPAKLTFSRCRPKTEITEVVKEYNKMISSFSGSLMARAERGKYNEVRNDFDLRDDFSDLYSARKPPDLPFGTGPYNASGQIVNRGSHLNAGLMMSRLSRRLRSSKDLLGASGKRRTSPLFVWTVILFVTPLLLTTITISAVVISSLSQELDESVHDAEAHFVDVSLNALEVFASLRADFVACHTSRSVRDLYLMKRYGSWLLFNGVERSGSFSETVTGVNECLESESALTCPYTKENRVCDCAWNYENEKCYDYPKGSRELQIPFFFVQADASLPNGTRLKTDFPNNSVSPNTTLWWDGPYDVPGSENNGSATTYSTSYDRLRTISAAPLFALLNNYDVNKENGVGHYYTFEDDVSRKSVPILLFCLFV